MVLTLLEDDVRTAPRDLQRPHLEAVTSELRKTYVDKVIRDLGLCITLYDVSSIEGGFLFPGDGAPRFRVKFRLVIFRPFLGEILVGKVTGCNTSGVQVSVGFFSDILIPEHLLQSPSVFDENEQLWIWRFNENDMWMDLEEEIRFRVAQVDFPPLPVEQEKGAPPFAPMQILGDINADGLGLLQWWT